MLRQSNLTKCVSDLVPLCDLRQEEAGLEILWAGEEVCRALSARNLHARNPGLKQAKKDIDMSQVKMEVF